MFNRDSVEMLADVIQGVFSTFQKDVFLNEVFDKNWDNLALKERVRQISHQLGSTLPQDYSQALTILLNALPLLQDQGFEKMVFPDFVELYGQEQWERSISALEEITQFISAEFAIRPFIKRYPEETLQRMLEWADHSHPGVRRLASEGCRPRLPWGMRLHDLVKDPAPIIPILEKLKDDPREEIRRSVANNLNDISKDHPNLVVQLLENWQEPDHPTRTKLIKHALRTLLKAGHPGALGLLGFTNQPKIKVDNLKLEPKEINLGEKVAFSFDITSTAEEDQLLMIDYLIHFLKANGAQTPKVFKLSQKTIQPGQTITIRRVHAIKPITTRVYYPGVQTFQPQINGVKFGKKDMLLQIPQD